MLKLKAEWLVTVHGCHASMSRIVVKSPVLVPYQPRLCHHSYHFFHLSPSLSCLSPSISFPPLSAHVPSPSPSRCTLFSVRGREGSSGPLQAAPPEAERHHDRPHAATRGARRADHGPAGRAGRVRQAAQGARGEARREDRPAHKVRHRLSTEGDEMHSLSPLCLSVCMLVRASVCLFADPHSLPLRTPLC